MLLLQSGAACQIITKASLAPGGPQNPGWWAGDAPLVTTVVWCFSWRRQRSQAVDSERGPGGTRALQGDHLLRGLLQPARGRLRQRDCRGPGKRGREVRHAQRSVCFCSRGRGLNNELLTYRQVTVRPLEFKITLQYRFFSYSCFTSNRDGFSADLKFTLFVNC